MKAGLISSALLIAQPLMATAAESHCNLAGDFAIQVKRLIDRGESPSLMMDLAPNKMGEEMTLLAINNRRLNQEDLRFLAVMRCKSMLQERQRRE